MTDQIPDTLIYQARECPILAISGKGLLTPADFGMQATSRSTACRRGYYMRYSCQPTELFLDQMTIWTEDDAYPEIGGVHPFRPIRELWTAMVYVGLRVATPFTGGLLIGIDLQRGGGVRELSYWRSYQTILELLFDEGNLQKSIDRSYQIAQVPEDVFPEDIEDVFTSRYDFFYPLTLAKTKR
jgi:hypothetical protein